MKKVILIIAMVALGGLFNFSKADPCSFGNLGVDVKTSYNQDGKCVIEFDFYFDISHNAGGKWFWIHIWPTSSYPGIFNYAKPPTLTNTGGGNGHLQNSILTFGFFHQGGVIIPQPTYQPDGTVTVYSDYDITEVAGTTSDRYTVRGLTILLPDSCHIPQSLTADAWESQANESQTVACNSSNVPFYVNDPGLRGFLYCQAPRTFSFEVSTISNTDMNITYNVFIDDGNGIYNSATDNINVFTGSTLLNNTNSYKYQSGVQGYLPYSNQKPYADRSLWVVVTSPSRPNAFYYLITNGCAPLPVKFASFSALRNKENVTLKWVTASELNNKGFYLERKYNNTDWQVITFIASQADNGNSSDVLTYNYSDYNNLKGVSEYRIRQVDIDNKATYSEIRLVKGLDQPGSVIVYPNPSTDGQLNIVLDNMEGGADMRLIDMNGRVIKQWINVTTNRLNINYISSGMYTLRVWMKGATEPQHIKVIVR
jgi:hypothetical protein